MCNSFIIFFGILNEL